jgi:putative Holliday junction resolvase
MRMMGLDIGDRRIGIAFCDPMEVLASAYGAIERKKNPEDIDTIGKLAEENDVGRIVVGLPRLIEGEIGTQASKAIDFARELSKKIDIPIQMIDERFSSSIAEDMLRQAGKTQQQIKEKRDAAAAALILQWYLDKTAATSNLSMENDS